MMTVIPGLPNNRFSPGVGAWVNSSAVGAKTDRTVAAINSVPKRMRTPRYKYPVPGNTKFNVAANHGYLIIKPLLTYLF